MDAEHVGEGRAVARVDQLACRRCGSPAPPACTPAPARGGPPSCWPACRHAVLDDEVGDVDDRLPFREHVRVLAVRVGPGDLHRLARDGHALRDLVARGRTGGAFASAFITHISWSRERVVRMSVNVRAPIRNRSPLGRYCTRRNPGCTKWPVSRRMRRVARSISKASPKLFDMKAMRLSSGDQAARSPKPVSWVMCGGSCVSGLPGLLRLGGRDRGHQHGGERQAGLHVTTWRCARRCTSARAA